MSSDDDLQQIRHSLSNQLAAQSMALTLCESVVAISRLQTPTLTLPFGLLSMTHVIADTGESRRRRSVRSRGALRDAGR